MDWHSVIGIGVAGNFTGHLEQAREASDFANLKVADQRAPKGIFPFYVPGARDSQGNRHYLDFMPISSDVIQLGSLEENHQIEPELSLLCELEYAGARVVAVRPRYAMAHNDCSIRRPGAKKISEKKNWGPATKGTSADRIEIDIFRAGGILDNYRLGCFLLRDGELHNYGVDSAVSGYSYFYETLCTWLIERMNTQREEGPLEDIAAWLACAEYPRHALISVGATRYTPLGESTFLRPGDRSIVVLYDGSRLSADELPGLLSGAAPGPEGAIVVLNQLVVGPDLLG